MGLANQFGENPAAYKCKNCGHTLALYAPCCPKCLDKSLVQVKTEKSNKEGFRREAEDSRDTKTPGNPVVSVVALAIILGLAYAAYSMFAPRPESRTEPAPTVGTTVRPQTRPRVSTKRNKRSSPVVSRTPAASTSSSTPRPTTPMKLWEAGSDDEE